MKRRLAASLLFTFLLSLSTFSQSTSETEDYSIDNYELTVETQSGRTSVRVTMDITYRIHSGTKSTGFKYVGNYDVEKLSGRDGDGKVIQTSVEHQRETRINWSFSPVGPGTKRIIVTFTIPRAITDGSRNSNEFEADWAGVFKVPVNNAVYRFVFPDNAERTVVSTPSGYTTEERNKRRSIEINQTPLGSTTFKMTFSPMIVDAEWSLAWIVGGAGVAITVLVGIVISIIALVKKAKRANWGSSDSSSWWAAGSSCAGGGGGSSGSSCGGGGGCGGGGCGG